MDNTGPLLQPVPSPRVLLSWRLRGQISPRVSLFLSLSLSLYAAETEKPEKPRRRDETTEREREVSRPRKESVDMARGGEERRGHATR